ncbi:SGNH/GDSL hydrolase family protein [Arthrobacter halodurans]|uniref:SGNH/GDSL hydrolase family protein n=1 Tax=Arthrobacter halodurans TaxID=516699 RepID=A0ABV4URA6_9MICC
MVTAPSRLWTAVAAAVAVAALVAASYLMTGNHPDLVRGGAGDAAADPAVALAAGPDVVAFAVVGDSITADHAYPRDVRRRMVGERSWVNFAQDDSAVFVGGWAVGGAKTAEMAAGIEPVAADVLVLIAGTNDIYARVPFADIGANLRRIVETVDAGRVLVSSVPPRNDFAAETVAYNDWLRGFVLEQGWDWVDAGAGLRDGSDPGRYAPGLAYDGVHPSLEGARVIGSAILARMTDQPTAFDGGESGPGGTVAVTPAPERSAPAVPAGIPAES